MRGLKAILTASGNLKRVMQDISEDIVVFQALNDVNLPKFTSNDVPLFEGITSDLFPGITLPPIDRTQMMNQLNEACRLQNLIPKQGFLAKCIQLYDTINVRHGLMIVGASFSGKSSVLMTL